MNRKKASKEAEKAKKITPINPFDDEAQWIGADFTKAPWTDEQVADYQKKLDSAFGAENAIVLAWSGDRTYWDEFYTDWFMNGLPKGKLEKKPILLFGQFDLNETDYFYVYPPRWLLLERYHPAQYEASWEASAWVEDARHLGGRKRIRAEKPSPAMYGHLKTIAEHDDTISADHIPNCCATWFENHRRVCYGRYRPPSDIELAYVRAIRENMDAEGVAQRNDQAIGDKVLMKAAQTTQHYIRAAQLQQAAKTHDFLMQDPYALVSDVIKNKGITLTQREIDECVEIGIRQGQAERLGASL